MGPSRITIEVLYFAAIRELVGMARESLQCPVGPAGEGPGRATVALAEVEAALEALHPCLKGRLASVRYAVNEEFVLPSAVVGSGDTLALIPPVSGG